MSGWLKAHGAGLKAKCSEMGRPVLTLRPEPLALYLTPSTFYHSVSALVFDSCTTFL